VIELFAHITLQYWSMKTRVQTWIYAEAYAPWHDETYLRAARQIRGYLKNFLTSPEGAFYTSQDADLVPGEHGGEYFQLSDAGRSAELAFLYH
jgi:uncharacterized protein YyaL (SSP411 family)